jgi:beta-lactamase regulating signal transducer with metallopeptidase domain
MVLGLAAIRLLPETRPHWRRSAALLFLCAALVLPFIQVASASQAWMLPLGLSSQADPGRCVTGLVFAAIWVSGSLVGVVRLLRSRLLLKGWLSESTPIHVEGMVPGMEVRASRLVKAPCVVGFFRVVLLVPENARRWSAETWRCVLAHERQHCKQGDLSLGWLAHIARALYWWHPLVFSLSRRLGLESEMCCDRAVLRHGIAATDYARELLRFAESEWQPSPVGLSVRGERVSVLRQRVERIIGDRPIEDVPWRAGLAVMLMLCGLIGVCWIRFAQPTAATTSVAAEATIRLGANPFPADP